MLSATIYFYYIISLHIYRSHDLSSHFDLRSNTWMTPGCTYCCTFCCYGLLIVQQFYVDFFNMYPNFDSKNVSVDQGMLLCKILQNYINSLPDIIFNPPMLWVGYVLMKKCPLICPSFSWIYGEQIGSLWKNFTPQEAWRWNVAIDKSQPVIPWHV